MNFIQAIILSIVEGFSEFLPISSTGHLILASNILKIQQSEFVKSFEIIIQLGAILAVAVLYYRRTLLNKVILKKTIAAFLPAAVVGFTLYKFIKHILIGNTIITLLALFFGGIFLIFFEYIYKEKESHVSKIENISYKSAVIIGTFQSLSIIPGVSRAAASIIGGMFQNLKRSTAVEFSFILAIPTMLAAIGLDLVKTSLQFSAEEYLVLGVGFIGAFIAALAVVKYFLRFIQNHTFIPFGIYRIAVSVIFWFLITKGV